MNVARHQLNFPNAPKALHAYRCEVCGHWHLTHMLPEKFRGRKEIPR